MPAYIDSTCYDDHRGCANPACHCPCHIDDGPGELERELAGIIEDVPELWPSKDAEKS